MSNLKTLALMSLVVGLTAPVLATERSEFGSKADWDAGEINSLVLNTACTAYPIPFGTTTWSGATDLRIWFVWTGTGSGLNLETCLAGTNFDTDIRIYTGNCAGTLTQVFYKDGVSACSWRTNLQCSDFTFQTGVTYYIRIDEYNNSDLETSDVVEMRWVDCAPPPPPPANDTAAGATPMNVGDCVTGNNLAPYTDTTGGYVNLSHLLCTLDFNQFGSTSIGASRDVWYQVTVPGGLYTFDLTGSFYDTVIGVFDASGNLVAGNDDFTGLQSKVECCQLPAGTYYIAVDGYGSAAGDYSLCVSECAPLEAGELPLGYSLKQNVPNPFNPTTSINFTMGETGAASLKVFDLTGREVATLVNGTIERGEHSVAFDASDLSSGVYFYTLQVAGSAETHKMVLMK
jgi:hypothetical protein